jgi:hypothetical protein
MSCTLTTSKSKDPVFIASSDSVAAKIRNLILTRNVNVYGIEKTTNGKVSAELTIRLINPLNEPSDEKKRTQLGKEVAEIIKQSIKAPGDYSVYTVLFVKEETNGSVTKSSYTGHEYKFQDL